MYRKVRNGVALCLLIAAALGTWYWSRLAAPDESTPTQTDANPLGYYLRDAVLLGTDDEGRVLYRIFAALAEERPEEGLLLLNDVRVEYQPAEQVPWLVRASRAETLTDLSYLQLEGDVKLKRAAGDDREATLVETNSLLLEPKQHVATATGPVSVTVGDQTLHAESLKAFLKEDRLELNEVHGRFP